jgi:hypothetical protein
MEIGQYIKEVSGLCAINDSSALKPLPMRITQEREGIYFKLKGHLDAQLACEP